VKFLQSCVLAGSILSYHLNVRPSWPMVYAKTRSQQKIMIPQLLKSLFGGKWGERWKSLSNE